GRTGRDGRSRSGHPGVCVTLHFAYGSNMSRAAMSVRCPGARALGLASVGGWRFIIGADGYASIVPSAGRVVYGVMWKLTVRALPALSEYENVTVNFSSRRTLRVSCQGRQVSALVYIARRPAEGIPRPGYVQLVVEAARDWQLPQPYIRDLQNWSSWGWVGAL